MPDTVDVVELTPEEIEKSWSLFKECEEGEHQWRNEPETSIFYRRCQKCGGAEGIRFP